MPKTRPLRPVTGQPAELSALVNELLSHVHRRSAGDSLAIMTEARPLMNSLDVDCLPVTSGPLLVGLVTREDLDDDDLRAAG